MDKISAREQRFNRRQDRLRELSARDMSREIELERRTQMIESQMDELRNERFQRCPGANVDVDTRDSYTPRRVETADAGQECADRRGDDEFSEDETYSRLDPAIDRTRIQSFEMEASVNDPLEDITTYNPEPYEQRLTE